MGSNNNTYHCLPHLPLRLFLHLGGYHLFLWAIYHTMQALFFLSCLQSRGTIVEQSGNRRWRYGTTCLLWVQGHCCDMGSG